MVVRLCPSSISVLHIPLLVAWLPKGHCILLLWIGYDCLVGIISCWNSISPKSGRPATHDNEVRLTMLSVQLGCALDLQIVVTHVPPDLHSCHALNGLYPLSLTWLWPPDRSLITIKATLGIWDAQMDPKCWAECMQKWPIVSCILH